MREEQIIEKASNALKKMDLYGEYHNIKVINVNDDDKLLEIDPTLKKEYKVHFSFKLPDGRNAATTVRVDKKTHKLLTITTKSGMYKVPEELS